VTLVCAAQLSLTVGDVDGNRRAGLDAITAAAAAGAGVVVLPELSDTGYVFADRDEALALADPGPTVEAWVEAARRHRMIVVGGYCGVASPRSSPQGHSRHRSSTPRWVGSAS